MKKKKINQRPLSAIIQKNLKHNNNNNNNNLNKFKLNKKENKPKLTNNSSKKLLNLKKTSLLNLLKKNINLISYRNKVLKNNNSKFLFNSSFNEKDKSENLKEYKFIPYIENFRNINKDLIKNLTLFNQLGNTYDSYITKKENIFLNKSKNKSASKELSDRLIHSNKNYFKKKNNFNFNQNKNINMNFTSRNFNNLNIYNLSKINSKTIEDNNKNKLSNTNKTKIKYKIKIKRTNSSKDNNNINKISKSKNLTNKIPNFDIKNILDKNDEENNNFNNHKFRRSSLIDRLIIKMSHPEETIEDYLNNNFKINQFIKFEKQLKQKKNNIEKMILDVKLHQRKTDRELEHYNPQLLIRKYILKTKYNQSNF